MQMHFQIKAKFEEFKMENKTVERKLNFRFINKLFRCSKVVFLVM